MELEIEKKFKCPYCRERISMLLDLSENGSHRYIEDCEVCCQPIEIQFDIEEHELTQFSAMGTQ